MMLLLTVSKNRYSSALCATITILPATEEPRNRILHRIKKCFLFSLHKIDKTQDENIRKYFLAEENWGHRHYTVLFLWKFLKYFFFLTKNLFFLVTSMAWRTNGNLFYAITRCFHCIVATCNMNMNILWHCVMNLYRKLGGILYRWRVKWIDISIESRNNKQ